MKTLESIKNWISSCMEWICMALVTLLTVLSIVMVFLRYCFDIVFIQAEEGITFLLVAVIFLGSVVVMREKSHVSVTLFQMYMPAPMQRLMSILQYVIIIAVNALLIYASYSWITTNLDFLTPGLRIPYWTIYIVVPISCFFSIVVALIDLIFMLADPNGGILKRKEEKT